MAKPRKSTLDAWLDTFLSWSFADREGAISLIATAHRAATQTEKRFLRPADTNGKPVPGKDLFGHPFTAGMAFEEKEGTSEDRLGT